MADKATKVLSSEEVKAAIGELAGQENMHADIATALGEEQTVGQVMEVFRDLGGPRGLNEEGAAFNGEVVEEALAAFAKTSKEDGATIDKAKAAMKNVLEGHGDKLILSKEQISELEDAAKKAAEAGAKLVTAPEAYDAFKDKLGEKTEAALKAMSEDQQKAFRKEIETAVHWGGKEGEISHEALKKQADAIEEALTKAQDGAKPEEVALKAAKESGKKIRSGFGSAGKELKDGFKAAEGKWTRMFVGPGKAEGAEAGNIVRNWKASGNQMKRGAGVGVGVILAGKGVKDMITQDQETGESHPVKGLIETASGVGLAAASVLKRAAHNPAGMPHI